MNINYDSNNFSRCFEQCLSVICLLTFLLVGVSGAKAQTAIRATSTNTKSPALSMNGKIAFTSDRDGNREIYLMNSDGTNQVRLTNNPGTDDFPEWSPDGSKLAFLSQASGRDVIKLMNADGTGQTVLTPVLIFDLFDRPSWGMDWSPDGTKIAFTNSHEIYAINIDGSNPVNLTNAPSVDSHPTWSPDGSRIMFTSDRIGGEFAFRLFTMTADGQNQTALPGGSSGNYTGDEDPAWSPDGVKLAGVRNWFLDGIVLFIRNISGTWEVLDWSPDRVSSSPAWSPDGTKIAYGAVIPPYVPYNNSEIFVINADGSGITQLTNTPGYEGHPSWQPLACANAIDCTEFFVRQHYLDFLNRDPDPPGYAAWQELLNNCPTGDTTCDRIHVSSAFFRSPEFQGRGYFVYRFYPVAFGRKPDYDEFTPDLARVSGFLTDAELEAAKLNFIAEFMSRPAFLSKFNGLSNTEYVDTLLSSADITHPSRGFWIAALTNGSRTRAQVLREIAESTEVYNKYYNQAFVVMQYFGYLHRQPDALYLTWIAHLDATGDYRNMIHGFLNSIEYRARFGP